MHAPHSTISVELLDEGMIVNYEEPVKRTRMVGGTRVDATTQALIQMLPQIMQNLPGSEDEEWDERKEKRKNLMQVGMQKAMEAMQPKAVEEWVWERRRVVASDDKTFMAAVAKAKEARDKAKKIMEGGEAIHHPYGGAAYMAMPARPPMPPPFADLEDFGTVA